MAPLTIREQVTNSIRDELVARRFPAGMMLREAEFANRFGVSRGPVRDAFILLSQEGYLAYHANRGVMVRHPPVPEERSFITSLRVQIEIHVIENGIAKVSEESIEKVKASLAELKEACGSGESTKIAICDIKFHESILVACGGEELVPAWRQLCTRMLLTYSRNLDHDETYREHSRIFEALSKKNKRSAIAAIKANVK